MPGTDLSVAEQIGEVLELHRELDAFLNVQPNLEELAACALKPNPHEVIYSAPKCTVEATHVVVLECQPGVYTLACEAISAWLSKRLWEVLGMCGTCGKPARECWSVRPV